MHATYPISHRLMAYILLLNLFLQSCNNFTNPPLPQESTPISSPLVLLPGVEDDRLLVEEGYIYEVEDQGWEARSPQRSFYKEKSGPAVRLFPSTSNGNKLDYGKLEEENEEQEDKLDDEIPESNAHSGDIDPLKWTDNNSDNRHTAKTPKVPALFTNPIHSGQIEPYSLLDVDYRGHKPPNLLSLYDQYVLGPVIGDGDCFLHAVFTEEGQGIEEMLEFSKNLRQALSDLVMSKEQYKSILRYEILADCKEHFKKYEQNNKLNSLHTKLKENEAFDSLKEKERSKLADKLAQEKHKKPYKDLLSEQQNDIQDEVLQKLPDSLKGNPPHSEESLLADIPDDTLKEYVRRYINNDGNLDAYIEIPAFGEECSIADVIAKSQDILIHCFLYDGKLKKLNHRCSLGNQASKNIKAIFHNGVNHYWALYNSAEPEARLKGIEQAASNYYAYKNRLKYSLHPSKPSSNPSSNDKSKVNPTSFSLKSNLNHEEKDKIIQELQLDRQLSRDEKKDFELICKELIKASIRQIDNEIIDYKRQVDSDNSKVKISLGKNLISKFKDLAECIADFDVSRSVKGGKIKSEMIFGENGLFKKIKPDLNIAKIQKKAELLNYLPSLTDKDTEDIWDQVFKDLKRRLTEYSELTTEWLYKKAGELQRKKEQAFTTLCTEVRKTAPHITEDFLKEVVKNLEESSFCENINVTGYPLSQKKLNKLKDYMGYCMNIYTDAGTRTFSEHGFSMIPQQWKDIINNKKRLKEFYDDLLAIHDTQFTILKQPTMQEQTGSRNKRSRQALSLPSQEQLNELENRYICVITNINNYLKQIKRTSINYKKLEYLASAMTDVESILQKIDEEYSIYFSKDATNNIPGLKHVDGETHFLTDKGIVAASFLHKAELTSNEKITTLDVGFRNFQNLSGILPTALEAVVKPFKANDTSWFEDSGEVDYISYLEEDARPKEKDKLFIVYSGSNSAKDWVSNFTLGHTMGTGLSVHEGIGRLFEKSIDYQHKSLLNRLEKHYIYHRKPKKFEINILGHSLGGGLASLAAYQYRKAFQGRLQGITGLDKEKILVKAFLFGSPAIIDTTSQETIETTLGKNNIFRIWTFDDPVVNWTENAPIQRGMHIGRSFPLYNIESHPIDFLDKFWGPHGASHYYNYLDKLAERNPPPKHKMLLKALQDYIVNEIILICGNPGVGKSSLCNSIFNKTAFRSGINFGGGMTQEKQEYTYENKMYIDTPGLLDINGRKEAAKEIETALKKNNNYKVIFVLTLEAGRFIADDFATINMVCEAITVPFEYGIIINKVSDNVAKEISGKGEEALKPYFTLLNKKVSLNNVLILKKDKEMDDARNVHLTDPEERKRLLDFISGLNANNIKAEDVQEIDVTDYKKKTEELEKKLASMYSGRQVALRVGVGVGLGALGGGFLPF